MSYKLENKEFDFDRVTVADALVVKRAFTIMANEEADAEEKNKADEDVSKLAIKYLKIKSGTQWIDNVSEDYIGEAFENELAVFEIIAKFQERIAGFMRSLPSFQTAQAQKQTRPKRGK
jgi:hypothetical protein